MNALSTVRRRRSWLPVRHLLPATPSPPRRHGVWIAAFVLLAACLVFCHGCHGEDADDELCVGFVRQQDEQP